jgi:hypothetical protein
VATQAPSGLRLRCASWQTEDNYTSPGCTCATYTGVDPDPLCQTFSFVLGLAHQDGCRPSGWDPTHPEQLSKDGFNFLLLNLESNDPYINQNYYELPRLNCGPVIPEESGARDPDHFLNKPPVSLVQPFFKCHYTNFQILTNSLSNAWANSSAIQELFIGIVVFFAARYYAIQARRSSSISPAPSPSATPRAGGSEPAPGESPRLTSGDSP